MWLTFFRAVLVLLLSHAGYIYSPFPDQPWTGAGLGFVSALFVVAAELKVGTVPAHHLVGGLVGSLVGLLGARLIWGALDGLDLPGVHFSHVLLVVFLGYIGLVIGARRGEWFEPARIIGAFKETAPLHLYKVLDTSVIIDGRIADVCETGFLEGTLVVPQFVLRELQQVADSSDSLKRNRGRRGLDILQKVQKMAGVKVQIVETDFPEVREVDLKLIELARKMSAKIVTNDFNLNKVAQLRGVAVLNINELANSLKPVVLPGEVLRVFVIKEGKEQGQGVAYLDDGTMVVVDQGRRALGRTIEVTVTSVLQTTAGKMIFCRWADAGGAAASAVAMSEEAARRDPRPSERRDEHRGDRARNGRDGQRREPDRRDDRGGAAIPAVAVPDGGHAEPGPALDAVPPLASSPEPSPPGRAGSAPE